MNNNIYIEREIESANGNTVRAEGLQAKGHFTGIYIREKVYV